MKHNITVLKGCAVIILTGVFLTSSLIRAQRTTTLPDTYPLSSSPLQGSKQVDLQLLYADSTAVILTFGQSNSTSSGQGTYYCHQEVYEFFQDTLFYAREPLRGAPGNGGCSVWTRLCDMLIDSSLYRRVILINTGIGSTTIRCWTAGACRDQLQECLTMIRERNIPVSHVIWHQGESDNLENTSGADYLKGLNRLLRRIRKAGIEASLTVCVASYHPEMIGIKPSGLDTNVRKAQILFARGTPGVIPGPDTDRYLLATDRYDGVHFSRTCLDTFAAELYRSIITSAGSGFSTQPPRSL
ncbi:MAG: hypothetical protein JXA23_10230 [Bacteroidales bacterium]|nr:hypothetical protein [Bacteroidales bacterium]